MPTESRTYQAGFASRPIRYGDHIYVWIRVPVLDDIHDQRGADGDWARWQLCKLEPVEPSVDPEEILEPTLVDSSGLISLEVYDDVLDEEEPLRAQPLLSKDLDADSTDPHPNAFVALSGQYLLFCPAPEAILVCWDLELFEEVWRIDSRRPENETQKAFRLLGVRDNGEFVVAFRERHFLETNTSTVLWNPEWGEDTDGVFLASYTMDAESSNVSPAGRLLLDPATGTEIHRWEAEEIEPELFRTVTEANNYYKYETLVDNQSWVVYENTEDDQAQFFNGQPFSLGFRPNPNAHQGTEFEIARVDPETGRSWTNMGLQVNGAGLGYTAVLSLGNPNPANSEPAYTFDSLRNEPDVLPGPLPVSDGYIVEDPSPGLTGAFTRRTRTSWTNVRVGPKDLPEGQPATFFGIVDQLNGYSGLDGVECSYYIESLVPSTVYKYAEGATGYSALEDAIIPIDAWVDWLALAWQNDDLVFVEDSGADVCENFVLPGAKVFSGSSRIVSQLVENREGSDHYIYEFTEWSGGEWWNNVTDIDRATMVGRFFFGSDQPEIPVPGTLPQHSLVRCCLTEFGVVYGPSVAVWRAQLPFQWRCVNWDGSIRWTVTIPTIMDRRQATVPVCVGGKIITFVQGWRDNDPGVIRKVVIDSDTGSYAESVVNPDLYGGLNQEAHESGVFLGHEAIVAGKRVLFKAGGRLVTA